MKKKRGFTLKSGNDIIGKGSKPSKFKMMGASPIRQDDEAIKQEKFTSAIDQISNNPNLTDDEIRQIVVNQRRGEGGKATSRGVNLSYREALSLRNKAREKQPKEAPAPKTPTVESPPTTIGELRQNLYHEGQVPGYFEGIADPQEDPVRREAMKRDYESGYTQKLRDALDRKYGASDTVSLGEKVLKGDMTKEEFQRAQYQMVDPETGELLPMSSAVGQTSFDYSERYPDDKDNPAFQMKKKKIGKKSKRGFQMKRKK